MNATLPAGLPFELYVVRGIPGTALAAVWTSEGDWFAEAYYSPRPHRRRAPATQQDAAADGSGGRQREPDATRDQRFRVQVGQEPHSLWGSVDWDDVLRDAIQQWMNGEASMEPGGEWLLMPPNTLTPLPCGRTLTELVEVAREQPGMCAFISDRTSLSELRILVQTAHRLSGEVHESTSTEPSGD